MKKAFAWLEGNGIDYQLHDYKKAGVPAAKLKGWIGKVGWEQLVNTKGQTFRGLPNARQQGLNAAKAADLLTEFPSAIRRPVTWLRFLRGPFTPQRHFAFEAVAWYWHFVDVVWLGLFVFVYWL